MKTYGLVGKNIDYSFSRSYFDQKFKRESLTAEYRNFDLQDLREFPQVVKSVPELSGLNVTIPYKQAIIPFLNRLSPDAKKIGAVNTIKFEKNGSLTGHNTDFTGFQKSIQPYLRSHHQKALILGTGGASRAIAYVLNSLGITYRFVSRNAGKNQFNYRDLNPLVLKEYSIIINCTPLGTYPSVEKYPQIPVEALSSSHLLFDLIYNPETTKLMELARKNGATAVNGLKMLEFQAEAAWEIWNS